MRNKYSSVEVLIESVLVKPDMITIRPVECPGVGRVTDFLTDTEKEPVCAYKDKMCPHFESLFIDMSYQHKTLICTAMTLKED